MPVLVKRGLSEPQSLRRSVVYVERAALGEIRKER
jgi:hypothetical protein